MAKQDPLTKARVKYMKAHTALYAIRVNDRTEHEMFTHLAQINDQSSVSYYLKTLVCLDMAATAAGESLEERVERLSPQDSRLLEYYMRLMEKNKGENV